MMYGPKKRGLLSALAALVLVACSDEASEPQNGEEIDAAIDASTDGQGADAGQQGAPDSGPMVMLDASMDAGEEADAGLDASSTSPDAAMEDSSVAPDAGPDASTLPSPLSGTWFNDSLGTLFLDVASERAWLRPTGGYNMSNDALFDVVALDEEAKTLVLAPQGTTYWNGGGYAKYTWTEQGQNGFYLCLLAEEKASLAEALADSTQADATTPDAGGCLGVPWLHMQPAIEITGYYDRGLLDSLSYNYSLNIDPVFINISAAIASYDNATKSFLFENLGQQDPGVTHTKLVWSGPREDGSVHLCEVDTNTESDPPAITPNEDDLENGCGGSPWQTYLAPVEPDESGGFFASETQSAVAIGSNYVSGVDEANNFYTVLEYDNQARSMLMTTGSLYAKLFWTAFNPASQELHFCVPGTPDADRAGVVNWTANAASLLDGCDGKAWTAVRIHLKSAGFNTPDAKPITSFAWGDDPIVEFSNIHQTVITQTTQGYQRVDWFVSEDDTKLYYCTSPTQNSSEAARMLPRANASSPTLGCNGGDWTKTPPDPAPEP